MPSDDEKIQKLYDALGDHEYKKIASREGLVVLAASLNDRLEEVQGRYNELLEQVRSVAGMAEQASVALAEEFTRDYGYNPHFDRKRERAWFAAGHDDEDPENLEYVRVPMEQRVQRELSVVFQDTDGHRSIRFATIPEVVECLVKVGVLRRSALTHGFRETTSRLNSVPHDSRRLETAESAVTAERDALRAQRDRYAAAIADVAVELGLDGMSLLEAVQLLRWLHAEAVWKLGTTDLIAELASRSPKSIVHQCCEDVVDLRSCIRSAVDELRRGSVNDEERIVTALGILCAGSGARDDR